MSGMDFVWRGQDSRILFMTSRSNAPARSIFSPVFTLALVDLPPPSRNLYVFPRSRAVVGFFIFLYFFSLRTGNVGSSFIAFFRLNEEATKAERETLPENGRKKRENRCSLRLNISGCNVDGVSCVIETITARVSDNKRGLKLVRKIA